MYICIPSPISTDGVKAFFTIEEARQYLKSIDPIDSEGLIINQPISNTASGSWTKPPYIKEGGWINGD